MPKSNKKCQTWQKVPKSVAVLGLFCGTYINFVCHSDSVQPTKNLFVAVAQCDKQNFFCRSDSLPQAIINKYPISLWHVTKKLEKKKPKTNILSNFNFTTAIKLLWGTFGCFGVLTKSSIPPNSLTFF